MAEIRAFAQLVDEIRAQPSDVRFVGVDGCGGAGKTTFAQRLVAHGDRWPVVHTDDFASHDEPLEWWPRLLADVIEPLSRQLPATYRPYDWVQRRPGDAVTIPPADVVVIEGVGATRAAWRHRLASAVWVETDSDLRLRRGLERDGAALAQFWHDWRIAEDRYVDQEQPSVHADLVVAGDPTGIVHDPDVEFVVLSERRRAAAPARPPR